MQRDNSVCAAPGLSVASATWPIHLVHPPVAHVNGIGWCDPSKLDVSLGWSKLPSNVPGDICPSIALPAERIFTEMRRHLGAAKMSHYVINVGAADGIGGDPLWLLLQEHRHLSGVAVEPGRVVEQLRKNYGAFPNMAIINKGVGPYDAASILRSVNPKTSPQSIDYLKVRPAGRPTATALAPLRV